MSDDCFKLCIQNLYSLSTSEKNIRYLAYAMLRRMNRQYITATRIAVLMEYLSKASETIAFKIHGWESALQFFEYLLPATLKMLIISHRPFVAASSTCTPLATPTTLPPTTPTIDALPTDDTNTIIAGANTSTMVPWMIPASVRANFANTTGSGDIKKKAVPVSEEKGLVDDDENKVTDAQAMKRQLNKLAMQRARLLAIYPPEPEATRVPAAIPLAPYRHLFDDTFLVLPILLRARTSNSNDDVNRAVSLVQAFYAWSQIFGTDELVAKPIFASSSSVDTKKIVEPADPFDLLQRAQSITNTTSSSSQSTVNATETKDTKDTKDKYDEKDGKEVKVAEDDDNNDDTDSDNYNEDEVEERDNRRCREHDELSDDEWDGDDDHSKERRTHERSWYERFYPHHSYQLPSSSSSSIPSIKHARIQLLRSLIHHPDDDVLSIYLRHRCRSPQFQSFVDAHGAHLRRLRKELSPGYNAHLMDYLPAAGDRLTFDTLIEKAEYLATLLEHKDTGQDSTIEIDRLGDAKQIDHDSDGEKKKKKKKTNTINDENASDEQSTTDHPKIDEIKKSIEPIEVNQCKPSKMIDDVVEQIMKARSIVLFSKMRAKFTGEPGGGNGPTREIFGIISKEFFGSTSPFFAPSPDGSCLHIRAESSRIPNYVRYYEAIGRFLAICLKDKQLPAVTLSRAIIKSILSREVNWHDLEKFDRPTYMTFKSFMDEGKKVDQTFPQYFVYSSDDGLHDIPLCVGGATLQLDDINKERFVNLYSNERLIESNLPQLIALVKGFRYFYSKEQLAPIGVDDLSALLSGPLTIDLDEWKSSIQYDSLAVEKSSYVKWFWQVVGEMNDEEKRKLLTFWSGTPHPPLFGFVHQDPDDRWMLTMAKTHGALPEASTCSFSIRLSSYSSLEETRTKIHAAINYGSVGYTSL